MRRIIIFKSPLLLYFSVMLASLLLQFILPWWIVVVTGFSAGCFSSLKPWKTTLIVFAAIASLWLSAALYISVTQSTVLLPRIAGLLQMPNTWMVYGLTVLVGSIPASLAALGASLLMQENPYPLNRVRQM